MFKYQVWPIVLLLLSSCINEEFDPTDTSTVIIEGYLYEGTGVDSIKISQLIPFYREEGTSYEITDAEVSIVSNGETYSLTHNSSKPGVYQYNGADLNVIVGNEYKIQLDYFGKEVSAITIVPDKPIDLSISIDSIGMSPITSFDDLFNQEESEDIEVSWSNSDGDYYFVLTENIEENPEDINQLDFGGQQRPNFSFRSSPTNLNSTTITPFSLSQFGQYRVVIFHVGQEYVDLYETSDQDSRNLTEPLSNVQNGLGIFSSFSSDTVYFEVHKL